MKQNYDQPEAPVLCRSVTVCIWAIVMLFVSAAHSYTAQAQFSGPALGASTTLNRRVTPTTDPAILYPASRDIHLGAGDLIVVHVYGAADYAPTVRVTLDGTVQLPLIGTAQVQGLSLHETERLI